MKQSDTPRTDAALCQYTGGEYVTFPRGLKYVVPADFAGGLEMDLTTAIELANRYGNLLASANKRIEELEGDKMKMGAALFLSRAQLAESRKFYPSHGTLAEDRINSHNEVMTAIDAAISTKSTGENK